MITMCRRRGGWRRMHRLWAFGAVTMMSQKREWFRGSEITIHMVNFCLMKQVLNAPLLQDTTDVGPLRIVQRALSCSCLKRNEWTLPVLRRSAGGGMEENAVKERCHCMENFNSFQHLTSPAARSVSCRLGLRPPELHKFNP